MLPDALTNAASAPHAGAQLRAAEVVFGPGAPGGTLAVDPRFSALFARVGLTTASAFLDMPGEVVSGHPDRHVARVEVPGCERAFYLKRQHVVGWRERWRNRRAGFGPVSRCEREAAVLQQLHAAGLPAPRWAAFGACGGRSFLLVEEVDAVELRRLLSDGALSLADRRTLAGNVGRAVAAVHAAGFTTPDLSAKHVFVNPESLAITFLDWQSAERKAPTDAVRADALGALHASLAEPLASHVDRVRALRTYASLTSPLEGGVAVAKKRRVGGKGATAKPKSSDFDRVASSSSASVPHPPPAGTEDGSRDLPLKGGGRSRSSRRTGLLPLVLRAAARHAERRSVRDQLQPLPASDPQRLVWLAGEAICATPEAAAAWPQPVAAAPIYDGPDGAASVRFAGREAVLVRGRSVAPLGRLRAWLHATSWRSPGVTAGRVLFHLQRYAVPAPRLIAFGQRITSAIGAEWFALYDAPPGVPLRRWRRTACASERAKLLDAVVACLDKLHSAGCVLIDAREAFAMSAGAVSVSDPLAVRIVRRVSDADRRRDLRAVARLMGVE